MDMCLSILSVSTIILIGLWNYSDEVVVFVFISLSSDLDLSIKWKFVFSKQRSMGTTNTCLH